MLAERQRISRELHDGRGQLWSFLGMQVQAARTLIVKQKFDLADQRLERLQQVIQDAHAGLRESITGLQADVSGDRGFLDALEDQLRWYREQCDAAA